MLEQCRWLYNEVLATRTQIWEDHQQSVTLYDTEKWLPRWKQERPALKLVHAQVLQDVCKRVDLAFQAFFRRVKAGENPGYPRFKPYGRYDSITYKQFGNGAKIHTTWRGRKELELSKIGRIKVQWHRPLAGKVKTVTLTRSATGKWYACFSVEQHVQRQEPTGAVTGVDMGLKKFATLASGAEIQNPRFFRKDEKDLHRLQRRWDAVKHLMHDHSEKQGRRKRIARCHERIRNRRNNFAHQFSRILVDAYDVVVFEDLTITNMQKRHTLASRLPTQRGTNSSPIRPTKRQRLEGSWCWLIRVARVRPVANAARMSRKT
jgi:putative transposase